MSASDDFAEELVGGTPGAQSASGTVIRFADTAGLYAATRFTYSDEEREEIIRTFEAGTGREPLTEFERKLFFFQLGDIGRWGLNTILELPDLETDRAVALTRIDALVPLIAACEAMNESENIAVATTALQTELQQSVKRASDLTQRINRLRSRYPGAGNNRWFAQILQAQLAEMYDGSDGLVSANSRFVAFHDAVMKPVLTNAAVIAATKCLWTEGMARTFGEKYKSGGGRRR